MNFEDLVNEHKDAVYRQMIRTCQNREDAEDVLMEALLRAYHHLHALEDPGAARAWLRQIARRLCWALQKRERLLAAFPIGVLEEQGLDLAGQEPPPDQLFEQAQWKSLLQQAITDLPEPYRLVYQLRDVDELSGESVTKQLGISTAAMKSRLHRARQMIRIELDKALEMKPTRGIENGSIG